MQTKWPGWVVGLLTRVSGIALGLACADIPSFTDLQTPGGIVKILRPAAAVAQDVDEQTNIRVYQVASPAVVSIDAENGRVGSGSLVTPAGLILTNAHVVGTNRVVQVRLTNGQEFTGDVVGYADGQIDLAAVQLRGNPTNLPTIQIAESDSVQVGQRAFVIGNPFGLEGTFTVGIVSRVDLERSLIQTDAAINPGNSGGPLLDSNARLVGVNTSIFTTEGNGGSIGIGFAIPVQEIEPFLVAVQNGTAMTSISADARRGNLEPQLISLNNTVAGRLGSNSDRLPDGSYFNAYAFEGQQGQHIVVEMSSQEVEPYLILLSQANGTLQLLDSTDIADSYHARLEMTLPTNGMYIILANAYAEGQVGRYNLSLSEMGNYLLRQNGRLAVGDAVAPDETLFDSYQFEGLGGQSITITVESQDFNTYLLVVDSVGRILADNDDSNPSTTNSELSLRLPATGAYTIIVNGYSTTDQGEYTLTIY